MHLFEITIQRGAQGRWPVVAEETATGTFLPVRTEGVLQLDLPTFETQLPGQVSLLDYGTLLGQALFRDAIRDAFVQALAKSGGQMHVLLFVETEDLRGIRWERLCAPLDTSWRFLSLDQRVPFCLYLPSVTDRRFPPIGRLDLRALILVASPAGLERYGLAAFDPAAAAKSVCTALGEIPSAVLGAWEGTVGPPTLDALCEQITAKQFTLLHVVCHGRFQAGNGETILYFATGDGRVDPVTGTRLLERLGHVHGARGLPRLAFLSTCESAAPEAGGALVGLAQRLVRELGMPAVVAMTERVTMATAHALTGAFYRQLREHGAVDRALSQACAGLAERPDVHVPVLYSRLGARPLFSDSPNRPLTVAEIRHGLGRARDLIGQRAPVWLKREATQPHAVFDEQDDRLQRTLHAEYGDLSPEGRRERDQALDEMNKLCNEAVERTLPELALGKEPPAYDGRCPFQGLYAFGVEDKEFFFGREDLVQRLQGRLAREDFLAVLGPSGSGKSSLVLAGLVPAMQRQKKTLEFAYMTPGSNPLDYLQAVLQVNSRSSLLVVDQFEEIFTLCTDDGERRDFLERLLELRKEFQVVLAMRADFWGECAPYRALKEVMQAHQELIPPMDAAELRRAMEKQAAKVGLRFEADLAGTILEHVTGSPGAMPLLQHALWELWNRRHGPWLRAEEYRTVGGVRKAIAETAEAAYRELSPPDQDRVQDIFVRLTRLDKEAVTAEDRRDTRQRVKLEELTPAGSDPMHTKALVKRLADARLIVTSADAPTKGEEVEVGHEALIQHWPRLRGWLDEDRASVRLRAGIREAARDWETSGRDENLLMHRGRPLEDAESLQSSSRFPLNAIEQAYIAACVQLRRRHADEQEALRQRELEQARLLAASQRRATKIFKWAAAITSVLFLLAAGLSIWASVQRNRAITAKAAAEETLATELFRPLGRASPGVNEAEVSALTALAELPEAQRRVRVLFIAQGLASPAKARRFAARAPAAIQAAVGLDAALAATLAEILRQRLANQAEGTQIRVAAALSIAELDLTDNELCEQAAGVLVKALEETNPVRPETELPIRALSGGLIHVTGLLPPERAADHLDQAARAMVDALGKKSNRPAVIPLARVLAELARALPPDRAASRLKQAANGLFVARAEETDPSARITLAGGVAEIARALPPDDVAKLLVDALAKESIPDVRKAFAAVLAEVAKTLPPEWAASHLVPETKRLVDDQAKKFEQLAKGGRDFAEISRKSNPPDLAKRLVDFLAMDSPFYARQGMAAVLAEVSKGLSPDRAAPHLLRGLAQDPELQELLIPLLREVAGRSSLPDTVGFLKHPLCYGEARLVFVRRVEQLAEQHFRTRWEMTNWLAKEHPETDPLAPPRGSD
jgi:hypothetical protein